MIDLDAQSLISDLATGTYVVTRRVASSYTDGIVVPGSTSPLTITAAVVPAQADELLRLPEGRRATATKTVYTTTQLRVGGEGSGNEADVIDIEGASWEVQDVSRFPSADDFYVCLVQRQQQ